MWPTQSSRLLEPGPATQSYSAAQAASHNLPAAGMRTNRCHSGAQSRPDVRCQICPIVGQCLLGTWGCFSVFSSAGKIKKIATTSLQSTKTKPGSHTHFSPIDYQQRQSILLRGVLQRRMALHFHTNSRTHVRAQTQTDRQTGTDNERHTHHSGFPGAYSKISFERCQNLTYS